MTDDPLNDLLDVRMSVQRDVVGQELGRFPLAQLTEDEINDAFFKIIKERNITSWTQLIARYGYMN